ncbi:MAG: Zn-ribbon domain-containing OB-fold protein [Anaerolineales bacterium]
MTLLDAEHILSSSWQDDMPVTNRYTFGVAGERFFRAIKDEGRIIGAYCTECERTYVPAVIFCERCLQEIEDWVDVGDTGEIITFSEVYIGIDDLPLDEPVKVAFIRLGDGGLIHYIKPSDTNPLEIGQKARVVFKPPNERQGSILDISHIEIIED